MLSDLQHGLLLLAEMVTAKIIEEASLPCCLLFVRLAVALRGSWHLMRSYGKAMTGSIRMQLAITNFPSLSSRLYGDPAEHVIPYPDRTDAAVGDTVSF